MAKDSPLTEESIRKIIVQALLENNGFLLAEIKNSETRLEAKIAELAAETHKGHDQIYDAIQEVMGVLDEASDKKIEKLRSEFAST